MTQVLDLETGRLSWMDARKLRSELRRRRREAEKLLKTAKADRVVYALARGDGNRVLRYEIIPCTAYSARKFASCFPRQSPVQPLDVRRR